MSDLRVPSVVIALLLIVVASAIALALAENGAGFGVWIYAVLAIAAMTFTHVRPDGWPGRLFEVSRASRTLLANRLLTQIAALACLLSAQYAIGNVSAALSAAGLLLFIHTLVLARLPRQSRAQGTN
jgi:hypothetical protein